MSDSIQRPTGSFRGPWPFVSQATTSGNYGLSLEAIENWPDHFQQFVNLDSQLELIMSAVETAIATRFADRCHVLVHGPPGCGKSEVLRSLCNLFGQQHAKFLHAPSLTKAGAEEYLLSKTEFASIVVLDELDKASPDVGTAWLQSMSDNPEINKTDARNGHRSHERRILVFAAANDPDRLVKRLSSALFDRLALRVFFPPPTPEDVRRILEAEADRREIDRRSVPEVLKYAADSGGANNLRSLLGLLRVGRDRWREGQYALHLMAVRDQERSHRP